MHDPNLIRRSFAVRPRMSMRVYDMTCVELRRRGVEFSQDGYFMGQSNFYVYTQADADVVQSVVDELSAREWA